MHFVYRVGSKLTPRVAQKLFRLGLYLGKTEKAPSLLRFSFDCDTIEDAECILSLDDEFFRNGINCAYCVPASIIDYSFHVYDELRKRGRVFFNHGYSIHTVKSYETDSVISNFEYARLAASSVFSDLSKAHDFLVSFLGVQPECLRAPHFGIYQKRNHIALLQEFCISNQYRVLSTETASNRWPHRTDFVVNGIKMLPLLNNVVTPSQVLDTFNLRNWDNSLDRESLLWNNTEHLKSLKPDSVNLYCDPSDLQRFPEYKQWVFELAKIFQPSEWG